MFVEIKTGSAINSLSARALADAQTWERFGDYYDATPSIFVGLSAFGHHVAQYTLNIIKLPPAGFWPPRNTLLMWRQGSVGK